MQFVPILESLQVLLNKKGIVKFVIMKHKGKQRQQNKLCASLLGMV